MKGLILRKVQLLLNPEKGFNQLKVCSFEETVWDYIKLLIFSSLLAGIAIFLLNVAKSAYFGMIIKLNVDYLKVLNYAFGNATSTIFFFLFSGTLLLFLFGALLKIFFGRVSFTVILSLLFYSMTPILLL